MTIKTMIGRVLQLPGQILLIVSFGAAAYAAYMNIAGVSWITPLVLGVVDLLYIIGLWMIASDDEIVLQEVKK